MAKIPTSTQTSLWQRLTSHAEQRWPQIEPDQHPLPGRVRLRRRRLVDGETLRLCRLRYGGSAHQWGFAIYRASHDDYEDSYLPTGLPGRHLRRSPRHRLRPLPQRPTAWISTPDELTGATTSGVLAG